MSLMLLVFILFLNCVGGGWGGCVWLRTQAEVCHSTSVEVREQLWVLVLTFYLFIETVSLLAHEHLCILLPQSPISLQEPWD